MAGNTILITGMSGLIGGVARTQLEGKHELRALNRSVVEGVPCHRADIAELQSILPAFDGIDTAIHLAAIAKADATWDELYAANIVGTYNVFEAARRAGVRRVIFASSGATVTGYEHDEPYKGLAEGRYNDAPPTWSMLTHETPVRPAALYGVSKCFGESLGRSYSDGHGLSVISLRIGAVNRDDRPTTARHFSVWCSQRDIAQMIERCVDAPDSLRYDCFFVTSRNRWSYRDLEHAREVVGFVPMDEAEAHRNR